MEISAACKREREKNNGRDEEDGSERRDPLSVALLLPLLREREDGAREEIIL